MKVAIAFAVVLAIATARRPAPMRAHITESNTAPTARHPPHHPSTGVIFGEPLFPASPGYPVYRYGGPPYSTCDRINMDRMLVGTCR